MISRLNNSNLLIAFEYLKKDEIMSFFISKFGNEIDVNERNNSNHAIALCNLIIEQQISFKAAITIKKKFHDLISNKSNKQILELENRTIQKIGVSFKKVEYMKNVLSFFAENHLDLESLDQNQIEKKLIKIKGIGKWTIEMFLMFVVLKPDIFSFGDLALINSIKKNYGTTDKNEISKLTLSWSPYRTVASLLLWFSIEKNIFYDSNHKL
ncbi:MAG: DNA-3-methyladenine glycosylase 2 family protein [Flavobacteriaceae bacterium]|nr:DNA-3-methyladenine glycosylase 2 family protein [Flavobacteriaceae bacterium]MBL6681441.1 DNA-3-methyladenine glycosylase 2 family protein [Flavobacteriaceae bacterium]